MRNFNSAATTRSLLLALAVVCLGLAACRRSDDAASKARSQERPATTVTDSLVIELTGQDSVTVINLTLADHKVDYVTTALGVFVKAIDSTASNSHTFWVYSVNDSLPEIACDRFYTRAGDRVRWHFRKMAP